METGVLTQCYRQCVKLFLQTANGMHRVATNVARGHGETPARVTMKVIMAGSPGETQARVTLR